MEPRLTMPVKSEREDLQDMLSNPGWDRFRLRTLKEFLGNGYRARMRTAVATNDITEVKAIQILATEVEKLLQWPYDRVEELEQQPESEDD